jgi:hypothetical protein
MVNHNGSQEKNNASRHTVREIAIPSLEKRTRKLRKRRWSGGIPFQKLLAEAQKDELGSNFGICLHWQSMVNKNGSQEKCEQSLCYSYERRQCQTYEKVMITWNPFFAICLAKRSQLELGVRALPVCASQIFDRSHNFMRKKERTEKTGPTDGY